MGIVTRLATGLDERRDRFKDEMHTLGFLLRREDPPSPNHDLDETTTDTRTR
jgi:hypothetical protein